MLLKTKGTKSLHSGVYSVVIVIIHLLSKSFSFIILMDMTMLKNHLALLFNFLNSKRSLGLKEPILYALILLRSLAVQEQSGQRAIFFYSMPLNGYLSFWLNSSNYKRQCHGIFF